MPQALYDEGVRRYGFHGLSYEYIARTLEFPRCDEHQHTPGCTIWVGGASWERNDEPFPLEFKLEAVRLGTDSDKSLTQIARELGIRPEMVRTWKRQAERRVGLKGTAVFPGTAKLTSDQEESRRLRREREQAKQENALGKRVASSFANELP